MDWSKTKTILIISFLLLNIFLFLTIMLSDSGGVFQSDYIKYAKRYLDSKDIIIESKVPRQVSKVGRIVYTPRVYDMSALANNIFGQTTSIPEKVDIFNLEIGTKRLQLSDKELYIIDQLPDGKSIFENDEKLEKEVFGYLKKLGYKKGILKGGKTKDLSTSKEFSYTVRHKDALVFDLTIWVKIDDDGVLSLSAPTWDVKKENVQNQVLSPYQVLIMANLPNGSRIEDFVFGYLQFYEGDLYGNPVWQITLSKENRLFFDAYTGEKIELTY